MEVLIMSLPTKITQALAEAKESVPASVHTCATKILDLLHQEHAIDEQLVVSESNGRIFLEWPGYDILCIISEEGMSIDRIRYGGRHSQHQPSSPEECAKLLGREVRAAISERSGLPEEELQNFEALPRDEKFARAWSDADAFFKGILKEKLRLDRLQIGQTADSFCFEWNRTYINIPIEDEGTRFLVHYIPDEDEKEEILHFKDVESALHMATFYVRRNDDI